MVIRVLVFVCTLLVSLVRAVVVAVVRLDDSMLCFALFGDRVSCSLGWPETPYVLNKMTLSYDPPASTSPVLELLAHDGHSID